MASWSVVELEPGVKRGGALAVRGEWLPVSPLGLKGAVVTLHFAVALRERQGPSDHSPAPELARLTAAALDGLEHAQAVAGGPLVVRASDEALDAVTALKTDLARQLPTPEASTVDEALSGSARLVRRMGALVAVTFGETIFSREHQFIAIEAARDSIERQARFLETTRSVAW